MNYSSHGSLPILDQIHQSKWPKKHLQIYKRATRSKKEKIEEGFLRRKMPRNREK